MKRIIIKLYTILALTFFCLYGYSQETRETAQLLTEPEIFTVEDAPRRLWYRYVADSTCAITISSDVLSSDGPFMYTSPNQILIFKNSSEEIFWEDNGINTRVDNDTISSSFVSEVSISLNEGEEVYIKVSKGFFVTDISISFNVTENVLGTTFQNPIPVSLDSIPMLISTADTNHSYVYFEFAPQENMKVNAYFDGTVYDIIQILPDSTYISTYRFVDRTVYTGETFIFQFPTTYLLDMDWYLVGETVELGYDCSTPIRLSTSEVLEIDSSTGDDWISFLPERDGYYTLTLNDTVNEDIRLVYSPYCFNDPILGIVDDTIESGTYSRYLTAGEERKFNVTGVEPGATYSVDLEYIEELPGDRCDDPIEVTLDSSYTQINPDTYFSFTPATSGDYVVTLSNLLRSYGFIDVLSDCDGYYLEGGSFNAWDTDCAQVRLSLEADSIYIINSSFHYTSSNSNLFSISNYTPIEGETCSDAVEVSGVGSHTIDHPISDIWLTYTVENSGTMYVSTLDSTRNDTYLQIYRGDCDNLIAENDNTNLEEGVDYITYLSQSYVEFDVEEGDIIYVKSNRSRWDYYGSYPITIGYTFTYQEGYSCDYPLLITNPQDTQTTIYSPDTITAFYEIILDSETEVTIADGNASNYIQLFSDCDSRLASSEDGDITRILPAGEYIFEWINTSGEDINWTISFNDNPDTDNDGIPNATDDDDDNDGVPDSDDQFPYDATESLDTDNDGLGNNTDTDDDGDGLLDFYDPYPLQPVSIDELNNECVGILVQPNPVNDLLQISGLESEITYSIKIIDSKGSTVLIQNECIEGTSIDVSNLETSIYSVLIQDEARIFSTIFYKK